MLPFQVIDGGYFTSDATLAKQVVLSDQPDFFWIRNRTAWGDDAAETSVEAWWRRGMAQGAAQTTDQTVASGALSSEAVTTGGFTFINTANPPSFTALASTAIEAIGGTFVVTMAETGNIAVGDYVRIYASTGALQIAGYVFQVTAVSNDASITLGYMASSGMTFAADATAAQVKKFIPNRMYPRWSYIANIEQLPQAKVWFTALHDYTPGEILSFRVPALFGMEEMNLVQARVLDVSNTIDDPDESWVILDLDSSGFTAFDFPTSAEAVGADAGSPAVAVPSSSGVVPFMGSASIPQIPEGYNLLDAFDNRNKYLMDIGSSVITSEGAIYDWMAMKFDRFTAE